MKKRWWLFAALLLLFFADFLSKEWARNTLPHLYEGGFRYPYGGIDLYQAPQGLHLALVYTTNQGAAWSVLSEYPDWLMVIRLITLLGLAIYLYLAPPAFLSPCLLIMTGALGNILDVFRLGAVVDMFLVGWGSYFFPVFNVADTLISLGVIWLMILLVCPPRLQSLPPTP